MIVLDHDHGALGVFGDHLGNRSEQNLGMKPVPGRANNDGIIVLRLRQNPIGNRAMTNERGINIEVSGALDVVYFILKALTDFIDCFFGYDRISYPA